MVAFAQSSLSLEELVFFHLFLQEPVSQVPHSDCSSVSSSLNDRPTHNNHVGSSSLAGRPALREQAVFSGPCRPRGCNAFLQAPAAALGRPAASLSLGGAWKIEHLFFVWKWILVRVLQVVSFASTQNNGSGTSTTRLFFYVQFMLPYTGSGIIIVQKKQAVLTVCPERRAFRFLLLKSNQQRPNVAITRSNSEGLNEGSWLRVA